MSIKAYLFTNMARQINHTYYSLENNRFLYFYHNLIDYHNESRRILIRPFVYEVEIEPETVFECDFFGLAATEFKIVREVEFIELVNTYEFSTVTKNEINSILNGTAETRKVIALYKRIIQKSKWVLSKAEQFKFLAILNQNHYELPTIIISEYSEIPYARLLKHFNKKYIGAFTDSSKLNKLKREKFYGDINFEYGIDLPIKELICHINLKDFIITRRLFQEQFEEYCEYMYSEERTIFHASYAIAAGYKILPKYKKHFYPYLIYSDPELALEVFDRSNYTVTEFNYFYKKNYKIADSYDFPNENIKNIKEIFVTEDKYKYI
jgi:hypothetical protein